MSATKSEARELINGDYVPKNPRTVKEEEFRSLKFRKTKEHEVYRCTRQTGYDPQSGPMYCGDLAEIVAFKAGDVLPLCNRRGHKLLPGMVLSDT